MYLTCRERDTLLSMHITHYDTSGHVFNVQGVWHSTLYACYPLWSMWSCISHALSLTLYSLCTVPTVFCMNIVDCLSFCPFSFDHCVVYPSSIYGFCLPFDIFKLFLINPGKLSLAIGMDCVVIIYSVQSLLTRRTDCVILIYSGHLLMIREMDCVVFIYSRRSLLTRGTNYVVVIL
jgi:hypothetical protein